MTRSATPAEMRVAIVVFVEIDDAHADPGSPDGMTPAGRDQAADALYEMGIDTNVSLLRRINMACSHPSTYVDGEYLRCSDCHTIVGSSGQGR